jgi:hypothetical protein
MTVFLVALSLKTYWKARKSVPAGNSGARIACGVIEK